MNFSLIDILSFFGFIAVVIGVSLYKSGKKKTEEDYFLAGRQLSWWLIGISIIASNVSSEHFVGQAGQGFRGEIGMAIVTWGWLAAIAMVFMALFLLPLYLKIGIYTLPEFLEYRYNRAVLTLMSGYMLLFYVLCRNFYGYGTLFRCDYAGDNLWSTPFVWYLGNWICCWILYLLWRTFSGSVV